MTRRRAIQPPLPLNILEMPAPLRAELRTHITPDWVEQAACASAHVDPDWWFTPADDPSQTVARNVCASCLARRSCLAQALVADEPHGIWGGFDETERVWLHLAVAEGTRVSAILNPRSRTVAA
jgi:hypothetical protein